MAKKASIKPKYGSGGVKWRQLEGATVDIPQEILEQAAQAIVDAVVREAKIAFAKRRKSGKKKTASVGGVGLGPEETKLSAKGRPKTPDIFSSFGYRIRNGQIEITSTWELMGLYVEGMPRTKMKWATRERGVPKVPLIQEDGTVVIRTTPLRSSDAWIHPGIAKYGFIQQGIKKGMAEAEKVVVRYAVEALMDGSIL